MIDHDGIIEHIDGGVAHVKIDSQSACSACHAKGVCGASDQEEKFLDVPLHGISYEVGEVVRVLVEKRLGFKAVAYGYFYPFLLLMAVLILALVVGLGEMIAGLLALLSLIPYYLGLYLARKWIESSFTFSIQKI
jgi:sigma-E factor negative regulatory protein RseC